MGFKFLRRGFVTCRMMFCLQFFIFQTMPSSDTTMSSRSVDSRHARGTDSLMPSPVSFIFLGHLSFCLLFLIQVSFILMDFFRAFRPSEVLTDSSRVKDSSLVFCQLAPLPLEVSVGLLFQKIANFKEACNLLQCSAYTHDRPMHNARHWLVQVQQSFL